MKRNYIPFIAGMSTMLLLVGLVGASLAGETRPPAVPQSGTLNGQVAYGEAGVALFGKETERAERNADGGHCGLHERRKIHALK